MTSAPQALLALPLALAAPAGPAPAAVFERRQVGLLVVDVKDSTPLHLAQGNRRAHAWVDEALNFAEDSAKLFDGVVLRRLGDGHLIAFPKIENALAAATAIQERLDSWRRRRRAPALELRSSVHAGRVLFDTAEAAPEIYGQPVERVLELAAASRGGDIAIDQRFKNHPLVQELAKRSVLNREGASILLRPRSRPQPGEPPGLQPPLTVSRMTVATTLFAGLANWTGTYERFGRRSAYATVKAFHAHARSIVERHGGLWVKTEGETVMASFAVPAAAVRAALEIQRRMAEVRRAAPLGPLAQARVGLNYGRALREDRLAGTDFFGNTVNAAARLMSRARPGEILVSEAVLAHGAAARLLGEAPREISELKGFDRPITIARIKPAPTRPRRAAVRRLRAIAQEARARVVAAP